MILILRIKESEIENASKQETITVLDCTILEQQNFDLKMSYIVLYFISLTNKIFLGGYIQVCCRIRPMISVIFGRLRAF
jgi:hypothetical protein